MPPPRDPDPTDATIVPRKPDDSDATLVPPGPDTSEVPLIPDRRGDPSTDSRLRLAALLDMEDDHDDPDEETLPPPSRPPTAAELVEETLLGPIAVDPDPDVTAAEVPAARTTRPVVGATAIGSRVVLSSGLTPVAGDEPTLVPSTRPTATDRPLLGRDETLSPAAEPTRPAGTPPPRQTVIPDPTQVSATAAGDRDITLPHPRAALVEVTQQLPGSSVSTTDQTLDLDGPAPRPHAPTRPGIEKEVGRYALRELHAKGGLGEVHTAHDTELNRDVALKRIQARFADDPVSRRRFLAEAEITARLDHPGVVPVFGLVADGHGRPCYAMRFIRGESLRDEIERFYKPAEPQTDDARRVAFRQLLSRFIAVCQAIGFAHTRNIVHRDIKPANVMVGSFGETLVVDWGLAKVLGEAADEIDPASPHAAFATQLSGDATEVADATAMGVAVGTPAYMAPEQAAGRHDILGPPADVYSLGATLYCILTGQAPFTGSNPLDTMQKVQRGEFVPPMAANPAAPKPLEAVCLKAMAVRPEDRYASALDLAADVEKWLCDEPVAAYPEPWTTRLARWARRNPARIAAAVSLLLAGLAATAVILVVVTGAKERTEAARQNEEKARKDAETSRDAAQKSEGKAVAANAATAAALKDLEKEQGKTKVALDLAKERFKHAEKTFRGIVSDIQTELADRAGTQDLRRRLLVRAEQGLKDVLATVQQGQDVDPVGANALLTSVHLQMGDVYRSLGQTDKAEAEYRDAADAAEGRVKAAGRPGATPDPTARKDRADANDRRADVALLRGNSTAALEFSQLALDDRLALEAASPTDPDARRNLASTRDRRAVIFLEQGRTDLAASESEQALAIRRTLADTAPDDPATDTADPDSPRNRADRDLAQSLERQADILLRTGQSDTALSLVTEAVRVREGVARRFEAQKDRTSVRRELAAAVALRGDVQLGRGRLEDARADYDDALRRLDDALARDPNSLGAMAEKAGVLARLAQVQLRLGLVKEGLETARASLVIYEKLAAADPNSALAKRNLATARTQLGDAYLANAEPRKALAEYEAGATVLAGLAGEDKTSARVKEELARAQELTGQAHLDADDPAAAVVALNGAVNLREEVTGIDKNSIDAKRELAATLTRRAEANLKAGNLQTADDDAVRGYQLFRDVVAADPKNRPARRDLASGYARRADVADRSGGPASALILAQLSTDEYATLAKDESDVQAKEDLAGGLERLADAYRFGGFRDARAEAELGAWKLRKAVANANPGSPVANRALMTSLRRLGDLDLEDRNVPEARKWYAAAAAVPKPFGADPIFARESGLVADRLAVCAVLEKNDLNVVAKAPSRVRGAALMMMLEPGREESADVVARTAWALWEHIQEREAKCREALAGLGLASFAPAVARDPEEQYRLAHAYAWCTARTTEKGQREKYAGAAVYFLLEARKAGFSDADRITTDPTWDAVHDHPSFPADLRPAEPK